MNGSDAEGKRAACRSGLNKVAVRADGSALLEACVTCDERA